MFGVAIPCLKHDPEHVFVMVLLRMGLLCRAGNYLLNLDCAALRAMTGHKGESAVSCLLFCLTLKTLWRNPIFWLFSQGVAIGLGYIWL